MATPIPFILLALIGKTDFAKYTSPFGSSPEPDPDPTPEQTAANIRKAMASLKG